MPDRSLALLRQPKDNDVGDALRLPPLGLASLAIGLGLRPPQIKARPEPSLLRQPKDNDVGDALRFARLPPLSRGLRLAIWLGLTASPKQVPTLSIAIHSIPYLKR